ncbi:PorV/PorQ family protein [Fulvivirga sediminis]|uniref:Type IX secretion system membrane protein PorP/SprF n=1 Tax=Fulvivirga sediminis TaxID=2803949 RepID=A0A937K2M0_9BACT|nr:hypothetical protein [Fulvivirga sediminis]MBL3657957.1 hypothetical protein [Fulvivirga sediminis]
MEKLVFILLFLLLLISCVSAQNTHQFGARAKGMGFTSSTMKDGWSLFNNPAGLSELTDLAAIGGFENKYGIEGLNTIAAGIYSPAPTGVVGLSFLKFGDDLYHEQELSLNYANHFGLAGLGIRLNYSQYHMEGYGNKSFVTIDFGGIASLSDQLLVGAYINNVNQPQISEFENERVPISLQAGVSYQPTAAVTLNAEVEKDIDYDTTLKLGLEYVFLKYIALRTGAQTSPFIQYFGLGFFTSRLKVDYALSNNNKLGFTHQVGISHIIKSHQ